MLAIRLRASSWTNKFDSLKRLVKLNRTVKLNCSRSIYTPALFLCSRTTTTKTLLSAFIPLSFTVYAWAKDPKAEEKKILQEADQLFDDHKFDELMQLLKSTPSWYDNAEVLWRVARCNFHMSKHHTEESKYLNEAYELIKRAVEMNEECGPAHKWAAILLDAVSTLQGTRARVEQILNVREHMEKAIKYSPDDPTAHFLLGSWHYSCYNVSWVERKLAAIIYGTLPDANLEVGLEMLERAEKIEPDFYSKNKVLLAQTLIALNKDIEKAKSLLVDVVGKYKDSQKWDDVEAVKDAREALKKLGAKSETI